VETVDKVEVERFAIHAAEWWDSRGKFRQLHEISPVRLGFIRERVLRHFGRDERALRPFSGLTIVDIGCGGGLVAEPLARLGATVTGVDPATENIAAAKLHAESRGLSIAYRAGTSHDLANEGAQFDCVIAFEVIEHAPDARAFLASCAALARPGGLVLLSTLNRTAKSYALAIVAAEYVLGWLPRGTHRWDRFVTPAEMDEHLRECGLDAAGHRGMSLNPLTGEWRLTDDTDVNYFTAATRPPA
jgi:2-polyprenyl-6-hydroxyphenyl methylase/3-demethylubiquinone-9 3-methyltransferase